MSQPDRNASVFALEARAPEAGMNRRPSWISRKPLATRPPPPAPGVHPPVEAAPPPPPDAPIEPPPAPAPVVVPDPSTVLELERLRDENVALQGRIADMAVTMARLRRDVLEASEPELVQLALSIAERVVGRELVTDPCLVVAWAREAVQALAAKDEVVIALAKDVASQVPAAGWDGTGLEQRIQTDAELGPGSVEVRAPEAVVAAGAQARLTSVAQALGVSEP